MSKVSKLIFCITSGRSGSHYLQKVLSSSGCVASFGEKQPTMCGKHLRNINKFPYKNSYEDRKIKVKKIKEIIKGLPLKKHIYSETNHMFIKTFFDVVIDEFGKKIEVIILRRRISRVLKSFIELEYFGKNEVSYDWMSNPKASTAAINCIGDFKKMDHYDRCIAYLIDIEARAQRFKKDYPNIKTHEVSVEDLNDKKSVISLFNSLEIPCKNSDLSMIGHVVNDRSKRKSHFGNNINLGYCKKRCNQYIKEAKNMGILIPQTIKV